MAEVMEKKSFDLKRLVPLIVIIAVAAGYEPNSHQDYEPGERFYFEDHYGTKYEVVSYA